MTKKFWDYSDFFSPHVQENYRITLGEGFTSIYDFWSVVSTAKLKTKNQKLKKENVFLKYEAANPTGSHKDRSFAYWISRLKEERVSHAVISSSGNSAISAARYVGEAGIRLTIFVSPHLSDEKRQRLDTAIGTNNLIEVKEVFAAKREAFRFAKDTGAYFLRSSIDVLALQGYKTIAYELIEQVGDVDAIFVPTSSGTTLQGIYLGFLDHAKHVQMPAFFAVQTTAIHPIAEEFDHDFVSEEKSLASSIIDRISFRKNEIVRILHETGGSGIVVSNNELKEMRDMFDFRDLHFGWESLMTITALRKVKDVERFSKIVCLCTS